MDEVSSINLMFNNINNLKWWKWYRRWQAKKAFVSQIQGHLDQLLLDKISNSVLRTSVTFAKQNLEEIKTFGWLRRWFNRTLKSQCEKIVSSSLRLIKAKLLVEDDDSLVQTLNQCSVEEIKRIILTHNQFYTFFKKMSQYSNDLENISSALGDVSKELKVLFCQHAKDDDIEGIKPFLAMKIVFSGFGVSALSGAGPNVARYLLELMLKEQNHDIDNLFRILIQNGDLENIKFLMEQQDIPDSVLTNPDYTDEGKTLLHYAAEGPKLDVLAYLLSKIPVEKIPDDINRSKYPQVFSRVSASVTVVDRSLGATWESSGLSY